MNNFRKKDLIDILMVYQNHINHFVNLSDKDIDEMFKIIKTESYDDMLLMNKRKIVLIKKQ